VQGLYQRDDRRLFFFARDEDVHLPLPRQHVPTREKQHRAPEPEPAEQPVPVHRQRRRCLDYLGRLFAIRKFHAEQDDDVERSRNGVCTGYHGIALVYAAVDHPEKTVPVANTVISGILIRVSHSLGPIGLLIISGKKLEVVSVAAATPIIDMSMSGEIIIVVCLSNNRRIRRSIY
jgi:hypothetical protein